MPVPAGCARIGAVTHAPDWPGEPVRRARLRVWTGRGAPRNPRGSERTGCRVRRVPVFGVAPDPLVHGDYYVSSPRIVRAAARRFRTIRWTPSTARYRVTIGTV